MADFPKVGSKWKLKSGQPLGEGPGMIMPGVKVEVVECDPDGDLQGAGAPGEKTVIYKFVDQGPVMDANGDVTTADIVRHHSAEVSMFYNWFEGAK